MASKLPLAGHMRRQVSDPISLGSSSASYGDLSIPRPTLQPLGTTEVTKYGALTGLPLPVCPFCGDEILELRCAPSSKTPGEIFFKCRLHDRDDSSSCPFYMYAKKYQKWLVENGYIGNAVSKKDTRSSKCAPVDEQVKVGLECLERHLEVLENAVQSVKKDVEGVKAALDKLDAKFGNIMEIAKLGIGCHVVVGLFVIVVEVNLSLSAAIG